MTSPENLEILIRTVLENPDANKRAEAVSALGQMRNGLAYEAIGYAMNDNDSVVRMAAVRAFEGVGAEWVLAPVLIRLRSNDPGARMVACRELGRLGDKEAVLPLIYRLNDPSLEVRVAAAYALGSLGDKRAIEPLRQRLRKESFGPMRQTIMRSLALLLKKR